MKVILSLLLSLLASCTFYGTPVQIENWPNLKIVTHIVTPTEVRKECAKYAPWWGQVGGCVIYYKTECHIWASDQWVVDIELDNCNGLARPYWRDKMIEIRDKIRNLGG